MLKRFHFKIQVLGLFNSYVLILSSLLKTRGLRKSISVDEVQASEVFSRLLGLHLAFHLVLSSHPCGVLLEDCDAQILAEPGVAAQQLMQLLLGFLGVYR